MKVSLIPEKCIACGLCQTYSNVFDYHDNGIVKFTESDNLIAEFRDDDLATLEAVKNCPTKALML
ncbi:ferredoxin [Streptococcus pluranimalium]|uniref:ferredoxin n=1 Tax=Streptococcus hyovaginalis TaxID=149015 RepID=UPI00040B3EB4|nr:ferredoxin [Streptococcus hyovaginalis]MDY3024927.1 ferredoxin [Streptococcus hyovaginalis]MDY4511224.1 ferredoxin [Streptococcus hyovaginalis]MDY5974190.1 ferredoxin [Streptococcus hyovaginalis]